MRIEPISGDNRNRSFCLKFGQKTAFVTATLPEHTRSIRPPHALIVGPRQCMACAEVVWCNNRHGLMKGCPMTKMGSTR
jgi:hypothetical protein